jgi:hypothetical protein
LSLGHFAWLAPWSWNVNMFRATAANPPSDDMLLYLQRNKPLRELFTIPGAVQSVVASAPADYTSLI